jgi:tRNA nucleotidyltransferase (CCA-adding enzyme)
MEWFRDKVRVLEVERKPPAPLLRGRDLVDMGVPPGPRMGEVLREVYERQLDGKITTIEEGRQEARSMISSGRGGLPQQEE